MHLGMVLQQAEKDGYSAFAATQMDSTAHLALVRIEADQLASTLPEPSSATRSLDSQHPFNAINPSASSSALSAHIEGFEDEDMELRASVVDGSCDRLVFPYHAHLEMPAPQQLGVTGGEDRSLRVYCGINVLWIVVFVRGEIRTYITSSLPTTRVQIAWSNTQDIDHAYGSSKPITPVMTSLDEESAVNDLFDQVQARVSLFPKPD